MTSFTVEGIDNAGNHTELAGFAYGIEAIRYLRHYVSTENAGNWGLIVVYDVRDPEDVTGVCYWERECEGE